MRTNAKEWLRQQTALGHLHEKAEIKLAEWYITWLGFAVNESATLSEDQISYLNNRIAQLSRKNVLCFGLEDIELLAIFINSCHE